MRKWQKVVVGSAGAVLVGAAGSGLWDLALRSLALAFLSGLSSVGTLGIDIFRDRIYLEAAKGFRELPSIVLLGVLAGAALGLPASIIVGGSRPNRADYDTEDAYHEARAKRRAKLRRRFPILVYLLVAVMSFSFLELGRLIQTNNVVSHFQQCMTILEPHTDAQDFHTLRARFAAMKTRREYMALFRDVELRAQRSGVTLPSLDWNY